VDHFPLGPDAGQSPGALDQGIIQKNIRPHRAPPSTRCVPYMLFACIGQDLWYTPLLIGSASPLTTPWRSRPGGGRRRPPEPRSPDLPTRPAHLRPPMTTPAAPGSGGRGPRAQHERRPGSKPQHSPQCRELLAEGLGGSSGCFPLMRSPVLPPVRKAAAG
jgi:hypothetical protein